MKKPHWRIGVWIKAIEVRALVQIALRTGEREILLRGLSSMLPRYDVFDVKRSIDFILNTQPTVFTAVLCAQADELSESLFQN